MTLNGQGSSNAGRGIKKECSEAKQAICKLTDKRLNVDAQFIAFNRGKRNEKD